VTTLEARVARALLHYATARSAEHAQLIRDLWEELHATQASWGEDAASLESSAVVVRGADAPNE
jgi:hypothetical protein